MPDTLITVARELSDPHHSRGAPNRYSEAQVSADYCFIGRQSDQGRAGMEYQYW